MWQWNQVCSDWPVDSCPDSCPGQGVHVPQATSYQLASECKRNGQMVLDGIFRPLSSFQRMGLGEHEIVVLSVQSSAIMSALGWDSWYCILFREWALKILEFCILKINRCCHGLQCFAIGPVLFSTGPTTLCSTASNSFQSR